jgi:hypothetical protein
MHKVEYNTKYFKIKPPSLELGAASCLHARDSRTGIDIAFLFSRVSPRKNSGEILSEGKEMMADLFIKVIFRESAFPLACTPKTYP